MIAFKEFIVTLVIATLVGTNAFCFGGNGFSNKEMALSMAKGDADEEFMRWARQSRSAGAEDNVVELIRPLGLILKEDGYRNVYVETVAPKGNAARTGKVRYRERKG